MYRSTCTSIVNLEINMVFPKPAGGNVEMFLGETFDWANSFWPPELVVHTHKKLCGGNKTLTRQNGQTEHYDLLAAVLQG